MPAEVNLSTSNPNVCPACVRLIDMLDETADSNEVSVEIPANEQIVPQNAALYGGTFVW